MKKSTYSNEIAKAVEQFLKEKNWHFDFLEKAGLFKFDLKISSKIRKIKYVIDVKTMNWLFTESALFMRMRKMRR